MTNRHERRKAATTSRKKLAQLNTATLDQHFEDALRRVRAEFERTGEMYAGFECVTDGESFQIPAYWPDRGAKAQACAALRDSFRRRKVNRYLFASEGWVGKTPGFRPTDDPDRGECVQVIAVERNGLRRYASAEITRTGATPSLGPWKVSGDVPRGWLLELLEDGYSDRSRKEEPPPVPRLSARDVQTLMYEDPAQGTEFRESFEICDQLGDLLADQIQDADSDALSKFMALESILRSIVQDMGSPKDIGAFARFSQGPSGCFPYVCHGAGFNAVDRARASLEGEASTFHLREARARTSSLGNVRSFHEPVLVRGFSGRWSRGPGRPYRELESGAPSQAAASGAALVLRTGRRGGTCL